MKKTNSLRTLKTRHPDCKVVKRGKHHFIINKKAPRYKAKQ
jgi:large subunit ribosomal protein L36